MSDPLAAQLAELAPDVDIDAALDSFVTISSRRRRRRRFVVGALAGVLVAGGVIGAVLVGRDSDAGTIATSGEPSPLATNTTVPNTASASTSDAPPSPATAGSTVAQGRSPQVSLTVGRSAAGQAGCTASACRHLDIELDSFTPGSTVTITCRSDTAGPFASHDVTVDDSGAANDSSCYYGYPGDRVWVTADGRPSPTLIWPGP